MPDDGPVEMAEYWDEWVRPLSQFPYEIVDRVLSEYSDDVLNLNDKGQLIKPAVARIIQLIREKQQTDQYRQLPKPEKFRKEPPYNHPMFGGIGDSPYSVADREKYNADRKEWLESRDYPKPPSECRLKGNPQITVGDYWVQTGKKSRDQFG